jgi:hypothetical protein
VALFAGTAAALEEIAFLSVSHLYVILGTGIDTHLLTFSQFKIPVSEIEGQNNPFFAFNHWINSFVFSAATLQWFQDTFGQKWYGYV